MSELHSTQNLVRNLANLPPAAPIQQLLHYAYRAKDAEETRHFYEDILGLPLFHIIQSDIVPSTGEYCPYTHFFFRLQDGSCIAFFDLGDDQAALPSPNTPLWVNHISFRVNTVQELEALRNQKLWVINMWIFLIQNYLREGIG